MAWCSSLATSSLNRLHGDEWIASSREPAVTGETLVLDVLDMDEGSQGRFLVCVIESRPVIVDGDVRHRIRLHGGDSPAELFDERVAIRHD